VRRGKFLGSRGNLLECRGEFPVVQGNVPGVMGKFLECRGNRYGLKRVIGYSHCKIYVKKIFI
jgi:hypothetical protein